MKTKLSASQKRVLGEIMNAKSTHPKSALGRQTWLVSENWTGQYKTYTAGRVFGVFNSATLRALEKAGLIKVHEFGGGVYSDEIEIVAA